MSDCTIWAKNELDLKYHDQVWGRVNHDEHDLFKMLILEGQQAGLSWHIILNKMDDMDLAYDHFDPIKIANYNQNKVNQLLSNEKIIRNKLKINATISNAQAYLNLIKKGQSLDNFLWSYVNFQPIQNKFTTTSQIPTSTALSNQISQDLKALGFKFVGSTIIYAYMQAIGMVNDHLVDCDVLTNRN